MENGMSLPSDYEERVYAGVLGKIIGVYVGRPFEQWKYERIMEELGEVTYYVNDKLPSKPPIVVTDDDISGTFTFLRALPDYGYSRELTPAQIGQSWLNYIIEERTILWWGGFGNSTEHTAYLRLKNGIKAPDSGSLALNGKIIAEQIGAQIFIDGWSMVAPGDPELAVDLAGRAASVSHDGAAILGAQVVAAMESLAFVESNVDELIDCAVSLIPNDSLIYRMIGDIREWHAAETDWHKTRERIAGLYNYENYGGNCHMVPNHALIILGLLYGDDDFQEAMKVVNTAGWDTDCNSGNLGCLLGIKNGLAGLDAGPDWRSPVSDRLFLAAADGGRAVTDALIETYHIVNAGRALHQQAPTRPKNGARFHFDLPGSLQGFRAESASVTLANVPGHSQDGRRALAIRFQGPGRVSTPTFILPSELDMPGYPLVASPTIYPGQLLNVTLSAAERTQVQLFLRAYDEQDELTRIDGPQLDLEGGAFTSAPWVVPPTGGQPVAEIGLACLGERDVTIYLDSLSWKGAPDLTFTRPSGGGHPWEPPLVWRRAWINGIDLWEPGWPEPYRLIQYSGRGLLTQGTRGWVDYEVAAAVTPVLVAKGGIGIRAQGMRRYYALLLCDDNKVRLIKALDGDLILAEADFEWRVNHSYGLRLQADGRELRAWVDDALLFSVRDEKRPLSGGAAAFVVEEGHMMSHSLSVRPL
jgi:ADP-ribosylglycohydrolase